MQVTTNTTISPHATASILQSDFSRVTQNLRKKNKALSLQPFINFRGQISIGNHFFPTQEFSLTKKDKFVLLENFPTASFPKIQITLKEINDVFHVSDFKLLPSDNSVRGEILYTRLFLLIEQNKKCLLHFKDIDFSPFNFVFSEINEANKKQLINRAKLFRKVGFLEDFFKIEFFVPENINANEVKQIDLLFRGLTEGEFYIPVSSSINVFNYKVTANDLKVNSSKREFHFEFNEPLFVLGNFFSIGKMSYKVKKGSIANPRLLRSAKPNDLIPELKINIFDCVVYHRFEKYVNPARLKINKAKLDNFRSSLSKEEPEFLFSLLDEPLTEVNEIVSTEIVEGLLQYHDFPDRFSVLEPTLKADKWCVPIALTYPDHEPIWLADAFIDVKTGEFEMKISFDELLKKGKKKAKEAMSIA